MEGAVTTLEMSLNLIFKIDTKEEDVFCVLSSNEPAGSVFSGHNSLVKIWDKSGQLVANLETKPTQDGDITCICASPINPLEFAVSIDKSVFLYDQRNLSTPLKIFKDYSKDEINEICMNKKGEFLCACDDSGEIQVIDINGGKRFRTCRSHGNICSSVVFHPRKSWEIISGGLDCELKRWDYSRGKPLSSINMSEIESEDPKSLYTINPPMIHTLCLVDEEPVIAVGMGNGSIGICDISQSAQLNIFSISQVHSSAVTSIQLPSIEAGASMTSPNSPYIFLSGGNDGKMVVSSYDKNPSLVESTKKVKSSKYESCHKIGIRSSAVINHGSKINSMAVGSSDDKRMLRVFVADQTSEISLYNFQ